jgi:hypothetical protein
MKAILANAKKPKQHNSRKASNSGNDLQNLILKNIATAKKILSSNLHLATMNPASVIHVLFH